MRDRLVHDVIAIVARRPLEIVLLCDGAPEMWGLLDDAFRAEPFTDVPVQRLVDNQVARWIGGCPFDEFASPALLSRHAGP